MAVRAAKATSYVGAGTVEFLIGRDGTAHFLEMNTRLQVEHGVTELVTGVDLVELQIRVAAGELLPFTQEDIKLNGHAIEARVYPEDPDTFMPDIGTVTEVNLPSSKNIRLDSALGKGYEVTLHYEPLLAKVMAWGETREEARKELLRALLAFQLEGVKCNVPSLRDVLGSQEFIQAMHHTGSLSILVEARRQRQHHPGVNGHLNGNGHKKGDREIAAAIGVAMALAMQESQAQGPAAPAVTPWRTYGRREQLISRTLGSRGWR
jgi:acetyl/propionyl-CoA carboxylase alpha subunit